MEASSKESRYEDIFAQYLKIMYNGYVLNRSKWKSVLYPTREIIPFQIASMCTW